MNACTRVQTKIWHRWVYNTLNTEYNLFSNRLLPITVYILILSNRNLIGWSLRGPLVVQNGVD